MSDYRELIERLKKRAARAEYLSEACYRLKDRSSALQHDEDQDLLLAAVSALETQQQELGA